MSISIVSFVTMYTCAGDDPQQARWSNDRRTYAHLWAKRRGGVTRLSVAPRNRKRSVALKLTVIARQLRHRFDQSAERSGLTRAKWTLIATVARHPGATQAVIADALEVKEITAGRMIDRLCDEGYLHRRENPNDRRAYCVYLTPSAQPLLKKLEELAQVHEKEIFASIGVEDLKKLDGLLDAISRNLSAARNRYREQKK
jgi:MarR family transcriptional regulator, transcriptional regulator for hemolysin